MIISQPVSKEDMSDPKAVYRIVTPAHPQGMIGYYFWPFHEIEPHPIQDCMFMPICISGRQNELVMYNDYFLATEIKTISYWEGVNLDELRKLHNWPDSSNVGLWDVVCTHLLSEKMDEVK